MKPPGKNSRSPEFKFVNDFDPELHINGNPGP
jgi:hypothetical protein